MTTRLRDYFHVYCLSVISLVTAHNSYAQWVTEPTSSDIAGIPGLRHETFESHSMKASVGYSVVLPPGYGKTQHHYPVVYWLHGGGGNESSSLFTSKSWQRLYRESKIGEVILVYPSGFRSGYMDHYDGKIMVESMIIRELIPRIDQRYRTVSSRLGRAVHGFSMGASGALKFAIKYPDTFCAAVAYGGGAIDLQNTNSEFILRILERNLSSRPELVRQNNTYHHLSKNDQIVRKNDVRFLLICGSDDPWKDSAVEFHAALRAEEITSQLKLVPGVAHEGGRMLLSDAARRAMFR